MALSSHMCCFVTAQLRRPAIKYTPHCYNSCPFQVSRLAARAARQNIHEAAAAIRVSFSCFHNNYLFICFTCIGLHALRVLPVNTVVLSKSTEDGRVSGKVQAQQPARGLNGK
jgi:hypothetical protein